MGVYDDRPWLARYGDEMPADLAPEHESALAMFEAAVRRRPYSVLLRYFGSSLTLAEADRLSGAIAAGLLDLGVTRGDRVALYLQNVPQYVLAMIAAWKAGAIVVSINPMNRERELAALLDDSGAKVLIALEDLYAHVGEAVVPQTAVETVITTSELDLLDGEVPPSLAGVRRRRAAGTHDLLELVQRHEGQVIERQAFAADDVAVLTYTSGTTGPPKGAMNTHGNVAFSSQVYRDWMRLDPDEDVILGVAPLFHVTGLVAHIGLALLMGAPLVLMGRFDAAICLEQIERTRTTFTVASITVFIALMNHPDAGRRDLSSLRKAMSGGAPVSPATAEAWEQAAGSPLHVVYGLTETTSPSHAVPFGSAAPVDAASGALSVGVPVFSTIVRVAGEDGGDVPAGELGEFVTSGPQVVPGYWRKPEESEHAMPGGALRTGDVGFMDEEGWFYLVDRKKDLINASGYKVWPREVEDVLYQHEAVREAAVVGVPDEYRGETVKAFVSLKPGAVADADGLKRFCKERMAAYKYPRSIEIVDELPKTASGKILRRSLRG